MTWIIAILVGALAGWIASIIMRTDAQQGAIANILIGIFGAMLGRWVFGDLLGIGSAAGTSATQGFNLWNILWSIVGAVLLIAILKALRVLR